MTLSQTMVGLGEVEVSTEDTTYTCIGLGSCVAMCVYDPESHVSGVAHFMLPVAMEPGLGERPAKFIDTGFPHFIDAVEAAGGARERLNAALVGGAQVLHGKTVSTAMEFGARNAQTLKELIDESDISLVATDLGGNQGRSMIYDTRSGRVTVRTAASTESQVGNLL